MASGVVHQVEQSATSSVAQQSTVSIVTPSQSASVAMPKRVARVEAFSVAENDEFVDLTAFDISDGDLHVGMKQIAMMSQKGTVGQCSIPGCDVSESSGTASTWRLVYAALDVCSSEPLSVRTVGSRAQQHEVHVSGHCARQWCRCFSPSLAWSGVGEYAGAAKVAAGFVDAQETVYMFKR